VGQTIELTVLRDGQEENIDLELAARPPRDDNPLAMIPDFIPGMAPDEDGDRPRLGIWGQPITPEIAGAMDLAEDKTGILIWKVVPDSPADGAGLQSSDTHIELDGQEEIIGGDIITAINDTPMATTDDFTGLLDELESGDEVTLDLLRDGEELEVTLTLG
jgi:S1-C subfamily serine protease